MPTVNFAILAGLAFLLLLARTRQDHRRFGNAVLLGLSLVLLTLALLAQVAAGSAPAPPLAAVTLAFVLLALGVLALAFFLIANGVMTVRKERSLTRRGGQLAGWLVTVSAGTLLVR